MIDEAEVLKAAQLNIRQGIQSNDIAEGAEYVDTKDEAAILLAVAEKMNEPVASGYQPRSMPPLGNPKRLPEPAVAASPRQHFIARKACSSEHL